METIKINKTFKEFHNVENNECPICGKKLLIGSQFVKLNNIAQCLECYFDSQDEKANKR